MTKPAAKPKAKGLPPAAGQREGVLEARDWSKRQTRLFLRLIGISVRYADHLESIAADTFNLAVGLAMMDQFSSFDEARKAKELKVDPEELRSHPHWGAIYEDVGRRARELAGARSVDEWAEFFENEMAVETATIAFFATSPRDKQKAIEEFTGRRSAKKSRELEQSRSMQIPEEFAELILSTMKRMAERHPEPVTARVVERPALEAEIVDASVLNVPQED